MEQSIIILNLEYALTFIALAIREVLWLRITLTAAQISLFTYHYFYVNNTSAAFWTAIFVIVNTFIIIKIIVDRRPKLIPDEIRDIYEGIFNNLSTRDFLYFWNMGTIKSDTNDFLIHSGDYQNNLLLVLSGEPASADVRANNELIFISWRSERLKNMQHENPPFWMKLQQALSEDLIKKVKLSRRI